MVEIIAGKYGPKLLGAGTKLNLSKQEEERLVHREIAKYCFDEDASLEENIKNFLEDDEDEVLKTEDEIRAMKKLEHVEYAKEIGVDNFDEESTKDAMIDSILNYIEENSMLVDSDEVN